MKAEKEILERYHAGDEKAFEIIYNECHAGIYFSVLRFIKSKEDAQDIIATTFIKLWTFRENLGFDSMKQLYGWLQRSARNKCIDYTRTALSHGSKEDRIIEEQLANIDDYAYEADDLEAAIIKRLIERIDKLPYKEKIVFKKRWLEDLKFREIAEDLNISTDTAKKRYKRAVLLIRGY